MTCDAVTKSVPLYIYGELNAEAEDRLEEHCSGCAACAAGLKRHRKLAELLERDRLELPPRLLTECRDELAAHVARTGPPHPPGIWARWHNAWETLIHASVGMRVPVGAMALVAVGYFGARLTPGFASNVNSASFASEGVLSSVRSVQPEQAGRVQISLDETRRRIVTGRLEDPGIQRLLLTAVRDESNAGVRVESVDVLKNQAGSAEVRQALLEGVSHDPNPGVRLKALDGLKAFAADPDVRKTLSQVLLQDANPGIRIQVIDLLVAHHDEGMVGVLQNLVRKEDNSYVRARCRNALQDLNASVGTF